MEKNIIMDRSNVPSCFVIWLASLCSYIGLFYQLIVHEIERERERRRKKLLYIDGNMKSINYIITFTCTQIKEIKSMKAKLQDGYHE